MPAMQETRVRSLGLGSLWRREWQSTPVLLPREFHGQRSQVGYSLWDWKELDATEQLTYTHSQTLNPTPLHYLSRHPRGSSLSAEP